MTDTLMDDVGGSAVGIRAAATGREPSALFDLTYDCDASRFEAVFAPTVHLHGFRDGEMVSWSAEVYRGVLEKRRSPKSLGAARADELFRIDVAVEEMAFTKVCLQINEQIFVDYLTWHEVDGTCRVTSKGFHLERRG